MVLIAIVFGCLCGLELLIWLSPLWRLRQPAAAALMVAVSVASALLLVKDWQVWTVVTALLSLYRLVNLLRLVKSRIQAAYLYNTALRTAVWLMGLQAAALGLAWVNEARRISAQAWLYGLALGQLAGGLLVLVSALHNIRASAPPELSKAYTDAELPPLTVGVPARNETDDLEACLQSLVASTYPKLEILVLDDCSQNKRTPEIIRSFAHAGVRFIAGLVPPDHWLAKNYAYEQLAAEANGDLLLFCGVDTRFEPGSLRNLVETFLQDKKTMVSLLPRNRLPAPRRAGSLLVQSSRYAWELALPRRTSRPPVLSTCWLITARALHAAGGFKAVSRASSPESYFARSAQAHRNGYGFWQANGGLSLLSSKSFEEQRATAIRTRYPQLHRRPEIVAIFTGMQLTLLIGPFGIALGSLAARLWPLAALSGAACILFTAMYARIMTLTYRGFVAAGLWLLPLAALYDASLLNYSMWQYEFREVIWKGRNICLPVMHTVPDAGSPPIKPN